MILSDIMRCRSSIIKIITLQRNTCSKLTTETVEKGVNIFKVNSKDTSVFIVNFEHVSHLFLVFLLLTLRK